MYMCPMVSKFGFLGSKNKSKIGQNEKKKEIWHGLEGILCKR